MGGTVARSISARSVHIFFFFFKLSLPSYATAIPPPRSERLVHRRRVFSRQAATITLHGVPYPPPPGRHVGCVALRSRKMCHFANRPVPLLRHGPAASHAHEGLEREGGGRRWSCKWRP